MNNLKHSSGLIVWLLIAITINTGFNVKLESAEPSYAMLIVASVALCVGHWLKRFQFSVFSKRQRTSRAHNSLGAVAGINHRNWDGCSTKLGYFKRYLWSIFQRVDLPYYPSVCRLCSCAAKIHYKLISLS